MSAVRSACAAAAWESRAAAAAGACKAGHRPKREAGRGGRGAAASPAGWCVMPLALSPTAPDAAGPAAQVSAELKPGPSLACSVGTAAPALAPATPHLLLLCGALSAGAVAGSPDASPRQCVLAAHASAAAAASAAVTKECSAGSPISSDVLSASFPAAGPATSAIFGRLTGFRTHSWAAFLRRLQLFCSRASGCGASSQRGCSVGVSPH